MSNAWALAATLLAGFLLSGCSAVGGAVGAGVGAAGSAVVGAGELGVSAVSGAVDVVAGGDEDEAVKDGD